MCGRFALTSIPRALLARFGLTEPRIAPRYNIAPTQYAPVVMRGSGDSAGLEELRWGLIPSWSRDTAFGVRAINARSETLAEKPAFREAFATRRCLVPVLGFYEWKREGKAKTPYFFTTIGQPAVLAGLWDQWRKGDETIRSFAIVTTGANALMAPIHDRMPVFLREENWEEWLDPANRNREGLRTLLRPLEDGYLQRWKVSPYVGNVRNEDEQCIAEVP